MKLSRAHVRKEGKKLKAQAQRKADLARPLVKKTLAKKK